MHRATRTQPRPGVRTTPQGARTTPNSARTTPQGARAASRARGGGEEKRASPAAATRAAGETRLPRPARKPKPGSASKTPVSAAAASSRRTPSPSPTKGGGTARPVAERRSPRNEMSLALRLDEREKLVRAELEPRLQTLERAMAELTQQLAQETQAKQAAEAGLLGCRAAAKKLMKKKSEARPAPFASRSVWRALLTPQVYPGSRYRCGRST